MAGKKKQSLGGLKDTTGGAKREDRQSIVRNYFEPISIDAENALTVIYMLRSPEGSVVLRAIASLERFGRKAIDNLHMLINLGIFDFIMPLIQHEDYLVKRFSQKLIAQLSALDEFRHQILADDSTVNIFVTILEKEEDIVMHEFSSLTLAELSSECSAANIILQIEGCVDTLFLRLPSPDPDVQKNCLVIMKNLLNELDGIEYFMYSPNFDLKSILNLIDSKYPVIQTFTLHVIDQFMSWSMDNRILFAFRDAGGVEVIISVVENSGWTDLHRSALDVLVKVIDNPAITDYLQQSGSIQRLIYLLEDNTEDMYMEKLLAALARLSQTDAGRKALHTNNMGQIFGEYLKSENLKIQEVACFGVASMAQYPPALNSIMSTEPTSYLLNILTDTQKFCKIKETASYALNILSHGDYRVAYELLEDHKFERFLPLLSQIRGIPIEVILNVLQIFAGIISNEKCRRTIITENVVGTILNLIQDDNSSCSRPARVQIAAMECLSSCIVEDEGRSLFQSLDGAQKLVMALKNRYASVRHWAALLVTQMAHNEDFVKSFIRCDGLKWLLENREMRYSAPSWESAIEALFRAYLPAKFAYTGRLDLHDLTTEGFFILRRNCKLFFILEDLLEVRASPAYPVFVANFGMNCPTTIDSNESLFSDIQPESQKGVSPEKEESQQENSQQKRTSNINHNPTENCSFDLSQPNQSLFGFTMQLEKFTTCPEDPYLPEYLIRLRKKLLKEIEFSFKDPQWLGVHPQLIRQRAQILANFVADEMSGPDPDPVCRDHFLEMHINDLRFDLETNVIPIGHVRIGSYLERAFLFKVLADKIGLPCALVRGPYGRAWVEIAIPVVNLDVPNESKETQTFFPRTPPPSQRTSEYIPEEEEEEDSGNPPCVENMAKTEIFMFPPINISFSNAFPTRLLRPNAIVDLVNEPGKILPINSYEAEEYRGCFVYMNPHKKKKGKYAI